MRAYAWFLLPLIENTHAFDACKLPALISDTILGQMDLIVHFEFQENGEKLIA